MTTDYSKDLFDDKGRPIVVVTRTGRTANRVVAGSDAAVNIRAGADDVLSGAADQTKLNADLVAATGGNVVVLGTIYTTATITVPTGTTLDLTNARISSQPGYREVTPADATAKVIGHKIAQLSYPTVYAKMGGSSIAPDNSIEAVKLTMTTPVEALEVDCYGCKDGTVLIYHDADVATLMSGTGNTVDQTPASWQSMTIDVTKSAGNVSTNTFQLKGANQDAWSGTYHPITLDDLLAFVGNKKVILLDCKNIAAIAPTIAAVQKYGLEKSVIIDNSASGDGSYCSQIAAAGIRSAVYWDGGASLATLVSYGISYVILSYPTNCNATTFDAIHAAGMKVLINVCFRYDQYKTITSDISRSVDGIIATDAWYARGFVNGDYSYRLTSDPFKSNTWYPGMMGYGNSYDRGYFTSGRFGFKQESNTKAATLQGWACPLANATSTYTITVTITADQDDSDTVWAYPFVFICSPTDVATLGGASPGNGENGYICYLNKDGSMVVQKVNNGTKTTLGSANVSGMTGSITFMIKVTPTYVEFKWAGHDTVTAYDTTFRGPYFYFGEAIVTGSMAKGHYSFSGVTIS
jgi:hypothetical protein